MERKWTKYQETKGEKMVVKKKYKFGVDASHD